MCAQRPTSFPETLPARVLPSWENDQGGAATVHGGEVEDATLGPGLMA
jgi:hypothetical protein